MLVGELERSVLRGHEVRAPILSCRNCAASYASSVTTFIISTSLLNSFSSHLSRFSSTITSIRVASRAPRSKHCGIGCGAISCRTMPIRWLWMSARQCSTVTRQKSNGSPAFFKTGSPRQSRRVILPRQRMEATNRHATRSRRNCRIQMRSQRAGRSRIACFPFAIADR
jgi:hypothetical protein